MQLFRMDSMWKTGQKDPWNVILSNIKKQTSQKVVVKIKMEKNK
jgi:hypothetical protein